MQVLKSITNAYGSTKIVGENVTEFKTDDLRVGVSEIKPDDIIQRLTAGSMKDFIQLPDLSVLKLGNDLVKVQVNVVSFA